MVIDKSSDKYQKTLLKNRQYKDDNRRKVNNQNAAYMRERRADPEEIQFRLREKQRNLFKRIMSPRARWDANLYKFYSYLGCSIPDLRKHLASFFEEGQGWHQVGNTLVIDHIKPLVDFDLSNEDDCKTVWYWTNLRIISRSENAIKANTSERRPKKARRTEEG